MKLQGRNGAMIVAGRLIKDAEHKLIGSKGYDKTTLVISESKTEPLITAVAWYELGAECANFRKGDRVLVAGTVEEREYNGRTYEDLNVSFILRQSLSATDSTAAPINDQFSDISADDCPFC